MTRTVSVTRRFGATPEQVFDAWLDPKTAAKFLFATATGEIVKVEIDPQVGGGFLIVDKRPDVGEASHHGTYIEIDRPPATGRRRHRARPACRRSRPAACRQAGPDDWR